MNRAATGMKSVHDARSVQRTRYTTNEHRAVPRETARFMAPVEAATL